MINRRSNRTILFRPLRNIFPLLLFCCLLLAPLVHASAKETSFAKRYAMNKTFYNNLQFTKPDVEQRDRWLRGIRTFQSLNRVAPARDKAANCLYLAARMNEDLYARSGNPVDLEKTLALYEGVWEQYSKDRLADDALFRAGELLQLQKKDYRQAAKLFAKIVVQYSDGDMAVPAAGHMEKIKAMQWKSVPEDSHGEHRLARIVDLRYGTTSYYTRIVIEASKPVAYSGKILPDNKHNGRQLYFDLDNAVLPRSLCDPIPVNDGLLRQICGSQLSESKVRVTLDTDSFSDYRVTKLNNPFRVVIDIWGKGKKQKELAAKSAAKQKETLSLPRQLGLSAKRIIIDPGHGGKDPGAIGPGGLLEKDITLAVALKLRDELQKHYGYEVFLTRDKDEYLSLEERTELANTKHGDIFVSIHVNSAPSKSIRGIETYFLSLATTSDEMRAAAKENVGSTSKLSDLQAILMDLMQNAKINESARLAESVQDNLVNGLAAKYHLVKNLGVKKAPFIVLIGAQMPSILTEIAFLSNPAELRRIKDHRYLDNVATQIASGISGYVGSLQTNQAASL
ncbi:MAG: N-acetylmuramoyl-L-alanine amidase [Deltaproteobacteria bacterium]